MLVGAAEDLHLHLGLIKKLLKVERPKTFFEVFCEIYKIGNKFGIGHVFSSFGFTYFSMPPV